ncbi:MAG: biotin/lipoyl-binding protein [Oscillospiraceae bacterium]|jgi:biotin carboxyl carrier protein|nr:biotin/lipoyl-binding protein [Oscillospiraceae bacterium]
MKKYRVNVNGSAYEIEIEEISASAAPVAAPAAPVSAAPAGGAAVKSPMPGTILDVKVREGQSVKKGDTLFILEAMKMENEIPAPVDGKIAGLRARKGDSVETNALFCTIV